MIKIDKWTFKADPRPGYGWTAYYDSGRIVASGKHKGEPRKPVESYHATFKQCLLYALDHDIGVTGDLQLSLARFNAFADSLTESI